MNRRVDKNLAGRLVLATLLCLSLAGLTDPAQAQEPPRRPATRESREQQSTQRQPRHGLQRAGRRGPQDRRGRGHARGGRDGGPRWSRHILQPSKEDHSPLRPGEEEQLREFMQQELPEFAKLLGQIEEHHPGAVRRGFSRIMPRLRHLRRIHEQNPELARLVETHAVNKYRVEMLRRSWQRTKDARRQQVEQRMRDCVATIVRAEQRTLEMWTEELATGREQRLADRLASLTQGDPDLARESPGVRKRVEEFASAADDARRQEVESELAAILERQFDHRLAALHRRVEELRDNAPEEVDRRMEHLLKAPRSPRSRRSRP